MHLFSLCPRRMCLVLSFDTKLDKMHSFIICLSVFFELFFSWAVSVPSCAAVFESDHPLGDRKHFKKLLRDFWDAISWNYKFRSFCYWPSSLSSASFLWKNFPLCLINELLFKPIYHTRSFYSRETCAFWRKMYGLLGCLRRQAINSTLQSRYHLERRPENSAQHTHGANA